MGWLEKGRTENEASRNYKRERIERARWRVEGETMVRLNEKSKGSSDND